VQSEHTASPSHRPIGWCCICRKLLFVV